MKNGSNLKIKCVDCDDRESFCKGMCVRCYNYHHRSKGAHRAKSKDLRVSNPVKTHGHSCHKTGNGQSGTYKSWVAMIQRCTNPNNSSWKSYGGRGITVCSEWRASFEKFLNDLGIRPEGKSIDRINVNDGYCPSNCRWATPQEQMVNRQIQVKLSSEIKTCSNCKKESFNSLRKGLCHACNEYQRRNNRTRPTTPSPSSNTLA